MGIDIDGLAATLKQAGYAGQAVDYITTAVKRQQDKDARNQHDDIIRTVDSGIGWRIYTQNGRYYVETTASLNRQRISSYVSEEAAREALYYMTN